MKIMVLFLYLLIIMVTGCHAQQKPTAFKTNNSNNTLLWKVSGKGLTRPGFLFGTFHLLCKDEIHFSDQLKSAINYADEIYMELDMDDPNMLMSGMMYMNMKDNKKLEDLYTPAEYKKISTYFNDTLHMPLLMLQKAKPYFLVALLYPKMMTCNTFSGVEEELVKLAKEDKKEILGLETVAFQSSVFDSIPYEVQAKELLKSIDSIDTYKTEFDTLRLAYKNQQLTSMDTLFTKSDISGYDDLLLNNRNANWVKQLDTIMKNKSVFVAVGAGHLAGGKGLINLLRKEGYNVEPLQNR